MSPAFGDRDDQYPFGFTGSEAKSPEESIDAGLEAVARARKTGLPYGTATALFALGISYAKNGRFEDAIASHREAAELYRELNDCGSQGSALRNLGRALIDTGRFMDAVDPLQRAATLLSTDRDYRLGEGVALADLGLALYEIARDTEAIEALQRSAAIFQEIGEGAAEGATLKDLGHILITARQFADAAETLRRAIAALHETDDQLREGIALYDLSRALFATGQHDAVATAAQAAVIFARIGEEAWEQEAMRLVATISSDAGVPARPAEIERAHALAHLFRVEHGGDLSDPQVFSAASAALNTCKRALDSMRQVGRITSTNWEALDRSLTSVWDGFILASDPKRVTSAEGCSCGASRIPSLSEYHSQQSSEDELKAALRVVAVWTAGQSPAEAENWIQRALDKPDPDPDQFILRTVILFVHGLDQETVLNSGWQGQSRDIGTGPAAQTITALMTAVERLDLAAADRILTALWHADPAQHHRRRYAVLNHALKLLGDFVLDRAHTVARTFLAAGGGHLADPTVGRAAHAALYGWEMNLAVAQQAGRLSEASYLSALSLLPLLHEDFTLAARYTVAG